MMDAVERGTAIGTGIEHAHVSGRRAAALGIGVAGVVLVVAAMATSPIGARPGVPVTDTSYDQVETLRASRGLAGVRIDDSYDRIESMRGSRGITGDRSYDQIERQRGSAASN
jgi:phage tail sheath gpL-like